MKNSEIGSHESESLTNFERCLRLCEQGDPLVFHNICILYEQGEVVEQK